MKKNDKIILVFYLCLIISIFYFYFYLENFNRESYPEAFDNLSYNLIPQPIKQIKSQGYYEIERQVLFENFMDVKNYPLILPRNILSVDIIEENENEIISKITVMEAGIKTTSNVKHNFIPFETYTVEILDGDAQGTIINQTFVDRNSNTVVYTNTTLNLSGILSPISYLPSKVFSHAINTVNESFVMYAINSNSIYKIQIDNLYREILFRPADTNGLDHFSTLLENKEISLEEIRLQLLNSEERQFLVIPSDLKTIDELNDDTKIQIDNLYREILFRPADTDGIMHFGNLFEMGKLTLNDIRQHLLNSEERQLFSLK
jgi:ribosome-associated toxin RatA of RatAB toxin-antitoxin module